VDISRDINTPMTPSQAIEAVTLQILKNPKTSPVELDNVGQYMTRREVAAVYDCPKGDITMDRLFHYAIANAETNYRHGYGHPLSREEYLKVQGNVVLVTGQAGIGKTTLTKMLTKLILDHDVNLPDPEFLFYIRVRDIDFTRKYTLTKLLVMAGCIEWDCNKRSSKRLLERLKKSEVVLFFDGIDEGDTTCFAKEPPVCDPTDPTLPGVIMANLMKGKLLPAAKKLWTSRQRQAYELHETIRPHTIVQVMGLDSLAQEELGKQLCKDAWPDVKKYLDSHPDVKAICYVPVMCIITMLAVNTSLKTGDNARLRTVTDVLTYALKMYSISKHLRDRQEEISKIPDLAWKGFLAQKIIFTEEDFKKAKISHDGFEAFIKTELSHNDNLKVKLFTGTKRSSFSHYIWQELFAAIRGLLFTPTDLFQSYIHYLVQSRWEVVAKLMFGICDAEVEKRLTEFLTGYDSNEFTKNKLLLKNLLISQIQKLRTLVDDDVYLYMQTLLQVSSWIGECRPDIYASEKFNSGNVDRDRLGISKDVIPILPQTIHFIGQLLPNDVSTILLMLPDRHTVTVGAIGEVSFRGTSLDVLCEGISRKCLQVSENFAALRDI